MRFRELEAQAFSRSWWGWLAATGLFLGCVLSCKWVGLFMVVLAGINTVLHQQMSYFFFLKEV